MIRDELKRILHREERHKRLFARLVLAFSASLVVFAIGTLLTVDFESGKHGSDIHGLGDAAFFTAVQLLTISSSLKTPITSAGKILDVVLEFWGVFVVTAVAGSFATFFSNGDS